MKIRSRFQLNMFLTLGFFLLYLAISLFFFSNSTKKITHLVLLETIEESLFELEVNIGEHARAVLHYTWFPDEPTLSKIEDSQLDLELHLSEFLSATTSAVSRESVDKIRQIDLEHKTFGDALVSITQQRNKTLAMFRAKVRIIDELIDEEFQAAISVSDPDIFVKLEAALDMEVNVGEAFATVDPIDRAIVRSINEIGHELGMQTIAEFLENQEIKDMLEVIGVDYVQGYAIHKPEPLVSLLEATS